METLKKDIYKGSKKDGVFMGELIGESVKGRLAALIAEHGPELYENLIDNQLLHHPMTGAYKAEPTKEGDDKYGVDRLPVKPTDGRLLWFDEYGVIRINHKFKPGQGGASGGEKAARYEEALKKQLDMLKTALQVDVLPDAMVENAKAMIREAVYGAKK